LKRVIIADDSGMARMFIRRCLEIAGLSESEFLEGANGEEVLKLLKEKPADLVVTDLNMPVMNGLELLKRIKSSPRLHDTPVLVITSTTNQKKVRELNQLGAMSILGKPISPSAVASAIAPLLEKE
jgi:two-component system chemotaxis response regulator CheY